MPYRVATLFFAEAAHENLSVIVKHALFG